MKHEMISPNEHYPFKLFSFTSRNPDRLISTHWHESAELLYCLKGNLEVRFPQITYLLEPGDTLFINSNIIHSSRSPLPNEVFVMQFPLRFLQEMTQNQYNEKFLFNVIPMKQKDRRMQHVLNQIFRNYQTQELATNLLVKSQTLALLSLLVEEYSIPLTSQHSIKSLKHLERLKQINDYVQENYYQALKLEQVAEVFNYDPAYFSRFFKKYMGIPFSEYVNTVRLEKAYYQLRDTDMTVMAIAMANGFFSVKSFYNVFKKNYNLSPQQYRKKYFS
ncbi:AraC family transcriptional regulator [Enterococcus wangshanyuanii]|uniref:AraC family transcriptional regulator n=1 Tax=Enterococcus wangshanyuanii TaxID=2005703 RepID=A0ABQ1P1Y0_9ENTE|nr:AraC family transcriptional regulator [Enterococcus wangshanyuanii]GGC89422.1 AraC family transcriptional regulator [Enterococcus wangshanyuanii]